MPTLVLSWYIGLMFGSVVSKFGHAAVAEAARRVPQVAARHVADRFRLATSSVSSDAIVDVPDVAAERAARQLVLGPVEVAAPAAVHLHPAVAAHVVGRAEARRDLVAEAELERVLLDVRRGTTASFSCSVRRPRFSVRRLPTVHGSCT